VRLSDLLGATVFDADGVEVGRVRDVRMVQDGPIQGSFGAGLRVYGLVVGRIDVASRLGYERSGIDAPWLVAAIAHRLHRHGRYVPWEQVARYGQRRIDLSCSAADLERPTPVHLLRGAAS
jgi:hypothetical protein